ncbi:MAG: NADH-quinone oxidoreductase subunit K [Candidatus Brocadiae bacterium]|nr:NADH-quinone oxidoreductase subunit K [Candidatus Brocadiia bacterium]
MIASLEWFLLIGAFLFATGVYTILTRKNAVSVLMGVELVLNAANINLIAFSRFIKPVSSIGPQSVALPMEPVAASGIYGAPWIQGQVFAAFVIVLAAAEAAVALGIILGIYRGLGDVNVDETVRLKG